MFFYVGRPAFAKASVGREGLEPSCLAALAPKASAYTNFATCPLEKL